MHENTLTTNQPKGSRLSVSSQVTTKATQANRNQPIADSRRPCSSWPSPGMKKLHSAAMMLPAEPLARSPVALLALVRGDRPIGWLLLLWPTWWGLWLAAEGIPPLWTLVVFTPGVWLTRSAGCVINDYADRWLDPQVERTRERPLASGKVADAKR
jgi:hypothetical protein